MVYRPSSESPLPPSDDLRDRERAALRLIYDAHRADDLARSVVARDADSLKRIVEAGRHAFRRELWLSRLRPGRKRVDSDLPLSPTSGANADDALALSLHLSLGLNVVTISDAFDRDPEELGEGLYRARRIVDPSIPAACQRVHEALGRYDDRTLDADARLELLTHVQRCDRCADVLARFRDLDSELRLELGQYRETMPPFGRVAASRSRRAARSVATVGVGVMFIVALLGAALLLNRLTSAPHDPVPVIVSTSDAGSRLVQMNGDGMLEAENLETGETRPLLEDQAQPWIWPLVSPSKSKIAYQSSLRPAESVIVIHSLDGDIVGEILWDETDVSRWPAGWLDDDTILLVDSGPIAMSRQYPPDDKNSERVLVAVDVESGEERVLHRGRFQWVQPSPAGTMAVVVTSYGTDFAGFSFELRSLASDGLGPIVTSVDGRAVTFPEWFPDSKRMFFTEIADDELPIAPTPGASGPTSQEPLWERPRLVSIDRNGDREVLFVDGSGQWGQYALTATGSDGTLLFGTYEERDEEIVSGGVPIERVTIWEVASAGDEPVALGDIETMGGISRALWSPDGGTLLLSAWQPFYLDDGEPDSVLPYDQMRSPLTVSYTVTPGGGLESIGVALGDPMQLHAWLPEAALPSGAPADEATFVDDVSAPEPVDDLPEELHISDRNSVSSDRRFLIAEDSELDLPVFWDRQESRSRHLVSGLGDASWLSGSPAIIMSAPVSRQDPSSRLTLFGEPTGFDPYSYGNQRWDPAGIGDDRTRRYAMPLVSDDGTATSFFVVDDDDGTTELWIASWEQETRRVASWSAPTDAIPTVPPVAAWVGENTLLFIEPTVWEDGMPQRSIVMRLHWEDDERTPVVEPLMELDGRGSDRGIAIVDLLPSPDGDEIAYRMRHYTQRAADLGRRDTIHVMSIRDATRSVEVARGTPGEGMSWSPDGDWLTAGLERRIILVTPDGTSLDYLTGDDDDAQYPIWVEPDEIWFAMDGHERAVWRVFVR